MKDSVAKFVVQKYLPEETDDSYLHVPLLAVNMRLFKSSRPYKRLILSIAKYMTDLSKKEFSDYPKLQGISGANLGIPFDIIGIMIEEELVIMINPVIVHYSDKKRIVKSNCGSLRLEKPIEVSRSKLITVSFFDINGCLKTKDYEGPIASTIQHEVDHNNGLTIEERHLEYEEEIRKETTINFLKKHKCIERSKTHEWCQ
jgi:peptide deformylase